MEAASQERREGKKRVIQASEAAMFAKALEIRDKKTEEKVPHSSIRCMDS